MVVIGVLQSGRFGFGADIVHLRSELGEGVESQRRHGNTRGTGWHVARCQTGTRRKVCAQYSCFLEDGSEIRFVEPKVRAGSSQTRIVEELSKLERPRSVLREHVTHSVELDPGRKAHCIGPCQAREQGAGGSGYSNAAGRFNKVSSRMNSQCFSFSEIQPSGDQSLSSKEPSYHQDLTGRSLPRLMPSFG